LKVLEVSLPHPAANRPYALVSAVSELALAFDKSDFETVDVEPILERFRRPTPKPAARKRKRS
jgi:hypothetical protein